MINIPSSIKDEDKWEKAKKIVKKEYEIDEDDNDNFWALVMGVYKKMKGKFKKKKRLLKK